VANTPPQPSFDAILKLVDDVMKVGTRKYEFSTEVPWFVNTDIVQQRVRSRLPSGDIQSTTSWVDDDLAASEVLGIAANAVCPENAEGLKAIGEHPETQYRDLRRRSKAAAAAQGKISKTSDRHWRQAHMGHFVRLTAKELYRRIHYSYENPSGASED
jgi:hypothetical protein